jgi:hypothetical protein
MEIPDTFFNVKYSFNLEEREDGGNPFPRINVDNCFFMKRNGTFVNTIQSLKNLNRYNNDDDEDILIVRRSPQGNYDIPNIANFDNYPELFDPLNPDDDRHRNNSPNQDIGANEPYKITNVTKGEIENFSSNYVSTSQGYNHRKQSKRRKHSKRRKQSKRIKQSKRRKHSKRMY